MAHDLLSTRAVSSRSRLSAKSELLETLNRSCKLNLSLYHINWYSIGHVSLCSLL